MDLVLNILLVIAVGIAIISTAIFLGSDNKKAIDGIYVSSLALAFALFFVPWVFMHYYDTHGWTGLQDKIAEDTVFWIIGGLVIIPLTFLIAVVAVKLKMNNDPRG
jgi:glucose-6-phosphate-specific signal transduction histidine kinase